MRGRRLSIPLSLSVVVSGGCPIVDDPSDTTTGETTTSTVTSPSTSSSTTVTTAPTTGVETSTSAEGTTGPFELPDCSVHDYVAECGNEPGCAWRIEDGGCVLECAIIPDQPTCETYPHCIWLGDQCAYQGAI